MLSVIVPVYNAEKTIGRCIESLRKQTLDDIQIVLVNDGSSDRTAEMCRQYAEKDKKIKYIEKENGGVSMARNCGIQEADGEYIAFVDADDYIAPDMYAYMLKQMKAAEADCVICSYQEIRENGKKDIIYNPFLSYDPREIAEYVAQNFNQGSISSPWNKLFLKKYITSSFEKGISLGEDLLFNLCYFQNIKSLLVLEKPLYYYVRTGENSLTSSYRERYFSDMSLVCEKAREYFQRFKLPEQDYAEVNDKLLYFTLHFMVMDCKCLDRKKAQERIAAYCESSALQKAAANIEGSRRGRIYGVFVYLVKKKKKKILYALCRIRGCMH